MLVDPRSHRRPARSGIVHIACALLVREQGEPGVNFTRLEIFEVYNFTIASYYIIVALKPASLLFDSTSSVSSSNALVIPAVPRT